MNNTLVLMILNLVGKLFSFFREMVCSYFYGTSAITDAFNTSTTAATLIFSVITYALSKTYIPTYSKISKERGEAAGDIFTNKLLNFSLFLCTTIMILGLVLDRKSTRLNSSHVSISYAVFCLKKKKKK